MQVVKSLDKQFTAGQASVAAGVLYHHTNHWCKTGLINPSVTRASGSDTIRVFSFADVVALRAIGQLREAGFGCESLSKVVKFLQNRNYTTVGRVYIVGNAAGNVEEVQPRQLLAHIRGGAKGFAWVLDLEDLVREADKAGLKKTRASRGRASLVA
jgi:DNA-binding transcriptional MerR regulator